MKAFFADLHIHSKYSRATSRSSDPEHLAQAAARKGVTVIGTGDCTHPGWLTEIQAKTRPAEPGLLRLLPELEQALDLDSQRPVRFLLTGEISTIYKKAGRVRKVHHLVLLSDLPAVLRFNGQLAKRGNLLSDGRPILGLDSRDLLEILLSADPLAMLIPAHIWTPWFSVLGAASGFDGIEACYGDLAGHIHALETGLSSDPPMNWRLASLDCYRLVSNSDAHSPERIGREANRFLTELSYPAIREALISGQGFGGTVEFFPEEGKYHLDGHRACGIRLEPQASRDRHGLCPVCGRALTMGVLHRVTELAALEGHREEGFVPERAAPFQSLVPLTEILAETMGVGAASKKVARRYHDLLAQLGPELTILISCPINEIYRVGQDRLAEAIARMRQGQVVREAGYDGVYGKIRLLPANQTPGSAPP